ncbi:MAG: hypothetical protein ACI822_001284, partial [Gammaproteobacteria bacterium]
AKTGDDGNNQATSKILIKFILVLSAFKRIQLVNPER